MATKVLRVAICFGLVCWLAVAPVPTCYDVDLNCYEVVITASDIGADRPIKD